MISLFFMHICFYSFLIHHSLVSNEVDFKRRYDWIHHCFILTHYRNQTMSILKSKQPKQTPRNQVPQEHILNISNNLSTFFFCLKNDSILYIFVFSFCVQFCSFFHSFSLGFCLIFQILYLEWLEIPLSVCCVCCNTLFCHVWRGERKWKTLRRITSKYAFHQRSKYNENHVPGFWFPNPDDFDEMQKNVARTKYVNMKRHTWVRVERHIDLKSSQELRAKQLTTIPSFMYRHFSFFFFPLPFLDGVIWMCQMERR